MIPYFDAASLELGPIRLQAYGVLVMLGWLVAGAVAALAAEREGRRMWVPVLLFAAAPPLVLPLAHLAAVALYRRDAAALLDPTAGFSAIGLLAGGVPLAVLWFAHFDREHLWAELDGAVSGLVAGFALARLGSFLAHDHPGLPTLFPLGVRGICPDYRSPFVACHDLALYELLAGLGWGGALALLRDRGAGAGVAAALTAAAWGAWRFALELLAAPEVDPRVLGLTPGQWAAPCFVALGALGWLAARVAQEKRGAR